MCLDCVTRLRRFCTLLGVILAIHCTLALAAEPTPSTKPDEAVTEPQANETGEYVPEKGEVGDDEFSAHGFNVLRVESEDKIVVPAAQADAVWKYLIEKYVTNIETLKEIDPTLTAYFSEELFRDTYYDTPSLQVSAMQSGVRHRRRVNLTNPNDRKSGRELMQIKVSNISSRAMERGELKYEIEYNSKVKTEEDAHPMLGIVKAEHRADFKQQLGKLGVDPFAMREILTIDDIRRRVYVLSNGKSFISISHDTASSDKMWAKFRLVEIEPELNEIAFTEGDVTKRNRMREIGTNISKDLMEKFPDLKRDLTPKYNKALFSFESQIPALRFLIKMDLDNYEGVIGIGAVSMGAVVMAIVVAVRLARKKGKTGGAPPSRYMKSQTVGTSA